MGLQYCPSKQKDIYRYILTLQYFSKNCVLPTGHSLGVQSLELIAPAVAESRTLVRTHEAPGGVALYSLHEQVRNPQSVEHVPCPHFLRACVLAQRDELKHVRVPRLQVHGKSTRPLYIHLLY